MRAPVKPTSSGLSVSVLKLRPGMPSGYATRKPSWSAFSDKPLSSSITRGVEELRASPPWSSVSA
jgi:hypothetical protein